MQTLDHLKAKHQQKQRDAGLLSLYLYLKGIPIKVNRDRYNIDAPGCKKRA